MYDLVSFSSGDLLLIDKEFIIILLSKIIRIFKTVHTVLKCQISHE